MDPKPSAQEMTHPLISLDEVQKIVSAAFRAPTGDNSQHWTYLWKNQELSVFILPDQAKHLLNNAHHSTLLSLGCLRSSIQLAAESLGWKAITVYSDFSVTQNLVLTFKFNVAEQKAKNWIPAIEYRYTDRLDYRTEEVPAKIIMEAKESISKYKNIEIVFLKELSTPLLDHFLLCDSILWRQPKILLDFLKWVRFSDSNSKDGMPWKTLGISFFEKCTLAAIKKFPILSSFVFALGGAFLSQKKLKKRLLNSGGYYYALTRDLEPHTLVDVGSACFEIWLHMNSQGVSCQPLSLASLTCFDIFTNNQPQGIDVEAFEGPLASYRSCFPETKTNRYPVWFFRMGLTKITPSARTQRLGLNERFKAS